MSSARTLTPFAEGGCYFECPRWHDGRWWASDFYRYGVFTYDADGREELVMEVEAQPSGLGWLPGGDLLVVSMKDRRVLRRAADGGVSVHADVSALAGGHLNDMVVDRQGRAYAGNFGFDLMGGGHPATAAVVRIDPDGRRRRRRRRPLVPERHGDHRRRHAHRRRDDGGSPHRVHDPARRHARRSTRVGADRADARAGRHRDDVRRRHLRSRWLRAGRRGTRVGGQRARRPAQPHRAGRADRRRGGDTRGPGRVRVRARRRGRPHAHGLRRARLPRGGTQGGARGGAAEHDRRGRRAPAFLDARKCTFGS